MPYTGLKNADTIDFVPSVTFTTDSERPGTTLNSENAIETEVFARRRLFLLATVITLVFNDVNILSAGKNDFISIFTLCGGVLSQIICTYYLWKVRLAAQQTPVWERTIMVIVGITVYSTILFYGIFSPASVIISFAVFGFSTNLNSGTTYFIALQPIIALLIIFNVIPDLGLMNAGDISTFRQIQVQAPVITLLIASLIVSKRSQYATKISMQSLESAMQSISLRDAQLNEAREALDKVLQVGGIGRFTGLVLGSYELRDILGRGSMGEVYEAYNKKTGEKAAVKLLLFHDISDPNRKKRFEREALIISSISSPFIVSVLETGATDTIPYFTMERLQGRDLSSILLEKGKLTTKETLTIVQEIGKGIEHIRKAKVIHRDLKPQNIFHAEQGKHKVWKILDFGVSKLIESNGTLTQDSSVGTPSYMAPEQAHGKKIDYRADIYSLAAIAYRTTTGRPPFSGNNIPNILYEVVHSMPKRPSSITDCSNAIDDVLLIGLSKSPNDRWQSCKEFSEALANAIERGGSDAVHYRAEKLHKKTPWS